MILSCPQCGAEFFGETAFRKWCSVPCRTAAKDTVSDDVRRSRNLQTRKLARDRAKWLRLFSTEAAQMRRMA